MAWFSSTEGFFHVINYFGLLLVVSVVEIQPSHTEAFVDQFYDHIGMLRAGSSFKMMYPIVQTVLVLFLCFRD